MREKHGAPVKPGLRRPIGFKDHPTERYPNGRPVQVATGSELRPALWCGFCGFPVEGDRSSLDYHTANVCPIAREGGESE